MAIKNGTNATDIIDGTNSGDLIRGFGGEDTLSGLGGNDRLLGGDGHDRLLGGTGADTVVGGAGEDFLTGGAGNDVLDGTDAPGEDGFDHADYSQDGGPSGVTVNLATGTATDSFGNTDTLIDLESVRGTLFADALIGGDPGNDNFEDFRGLAGNDTINGGSGWDRASYTNDFFHGGNLGVVVNLAAGTARDGFGDTDTLINIEAVRGTNFADELIGNGGGNGFEPMGGSDYVDGGAGIDRVSYHVDHFFQQNDNGRVGIRADLALGQIVDTSGYYVDTVVRIENVSGSTFDDEIRGNGVANDLRGREGDDFLAGRGGNDRLQGEQGQDFLHGGAGADTLIGGTGDDVLHGALGADSFVFRPGDDHDIVRRFQNGTDRIDVTAYGYASAADVIALASQDGADVVIENGEDQITLLNFKLANVDAADFVV